MQRNGVDVEALSMVDVAAPPPLVSADDVPLGFVVVLVEKLPPPDEPLPQFTHAPPPVVGVAPEPLYTSPPYVPSPYVLAEATTGVPRTTIPATRSPTHVRLLPIRAAAIPFLSPLIREHLAGELRDDERHDAAEDECEEPAARYLVVHGVYVSAL
jgi:hypothetical protein